MDDLQKRTTHGFKNRPSYQLRLLANRIKQQRTRTAADVVRLGELLHRAKKLTKHGRFTEWVQNRTNLSLRSAQQALTAHKRMSKVPLETLRKCCPTAVRVLAMKRVSRSPKLLAKVLEAPVGPDGLIGYRDMQSALSSVSSKLVHFRDPPETPNNVLGRQLMKLVSDPLITTLHIGFDRASAVHPEVIPQVSVTIFREGQIAEICSRDSFPEAIAKAVGEERRIFCTKCQVLKMASAFNKSSHYCRACDKPRVKAWNEANRPRKSAPAKKANNLFDPENN